MKPPGAASASASQSRCTAWSLSPCIWRATAWSTITLSCSSAHPLASTCRRHGKSTASAADGYLPRQLGTLLSVLRGFLQVIPFVEDTGQAKMRFASHPLRRITGQLQAALVALGRQRQLVVCFLYLAQIDGSRQGVDGIPKRLPDSYDFGIGPPRRGTVSLELIGIS